MNTYTIRVTNSDVCHTVNAEDAVEAVKYWIADGGPLLERYVVYDCDLNRSVVDVTKKVVAG